MQAINTDNDAENGQGIVLIVEDNPSTQKLLFTQLSARGYQPNVAGDGQTALAWLERNKADLIVLDLMLPDINGIDLCHRIRQRHSATILPIIILSALGGEPNDRVLGLEAGANDFMAKPYLAEELIARINNLIQIKREAQKAETLLSRYMARALRKQAELAPDLLQHRERRYGVIMFAELRGFSRFSSAPQDADALRVVDNFFEAMMGVVEDHGGIVFDVIGDSLLAVFNIPYQVPFPSFLAAQAGIELQRFFLLLQQEQPQSTLAVGLGVGIAQGDVVIGNIGMINGGAQRHTVMGSVVNLANRFASMASNGEVLMPPAVFHEARVPADVSVSYSPAVMVKGVETPLPVYRLRPPEKPTSAPPA